MGVRGKRTNGLDRTYELLQRRADRSKHLFKRAGCALRSKHNASTGTGKPTELITDDRSESWIIIVSNAERLPQFSTIKPALQGPVQFQKHSRESYSVQIALQQAGTSPTIIHFSLPNHRGGGTGRVGVSEWSPSRVNSSTECPNYVWQGLKAPLSVRIMSEQA
jgi:hypothetical protein